MSSRRARLALPLTLWLLGCHAAAPARARAEVPAGVRSLAWSSASSSPKAAEPQFPCTLVLGVTVTREWFEAGFQQIAPDLEWEAITEPHASLEQWADEHDAVWSHAPRSACAAHPLAPDRVLFTAMDWEHTTEAEWEAALAAAVGTIARRFPSAREIMLLSMIRAPGNTSCGNPMSVVPPFVDAAMLAVAARLSERVRVGPKFEAPACEAFKDGGPHFTEAGRVAMARRIAAYFTGQP